MPPLPPPSIIVGALALYAVGGAEHLEVADAAWRSWTYVADAGNHADSEGMGPRVVSVCVSVGGMLVFALMVGLVSESIGEKVDSLRKGKSDVIERNHTLILGWNDKLVRGGGGVGDDESLGDAGRADGGLSHFKTCHQSCLSTPTDLGCI